MTLNLKQFKPNLLPNEQVNIKDMKYPLVASYKLDGIRACFIDGELYSRSLKLLPNIHLHDKFKALKAYSHANNCILDGELYCTSIPFNDLSGIIRSDDHELPKDLEFWCFDLLTKDNLPFEQRYQAYRKLDNQFAPYFHPVVQTLVTDATTVEVSFEVALQNGFEGLVLRNPNSYYKFGRCTAKSGDAYKAKPYQDFDAKIIGVTQATVVDPKAEKTTNELGRSVTSKKVGDRILINKAATFIVLYNGKENGVSLSMTDEEKKEIWLNKKDYIGRWIQYKGLLVGSKDVPRHSVFIRYRDDKM